MVSDPVLNLIEIEEKTVQKINPLTKKEKNFIEGRAIYEFQAKYVISIDEVNSSSGDEVITRARLTAKEAVRNAMFGIVMKSMELCGNDFGSITIYSPASISKPILVIPKTKKSTWKI